MTADYLTAVRDFHYREVEPYLGPPQGCTQAEVDNLEHALGYPLPEAYRQYLLWMGADHGGIFVGCDWHLRNVLANNKRLPELLAENRVNWQLPPHYVTFMTHQGYVAAYFGLPKESDDPPVYSYNECGTELMVTKQGTFTEFLLQDMKGLTESMQEVVEKRSGEA
jgi:hypothetical protein